jgi:hypothetical protein
MIKDSKILLRVSYPRWFLIVFGSAGIITLIFSIFAVIYYSQDKFTTPELWKSLFFLAIIAGGLWIIPYIYCAVVATESGLQRVDLFGRRQHFSWDEIVRVAKPRFGIPREAVYVYSKNGKKMALLKGMNGYSDLLEIIQRRAPNLPSEKLTEDFLPKRYSWREFLRVFLVLFALVFIYGVLRHLFDF